MDTSIQALDNPEQKKMKAAAIGEQPMETVGVYLKKERTTRNLSLHEVARLTKISELYLDCIEKDDFDKIPKGPYVKGYISSYSRMIGGDTEQALKLYESAHNTLSQANPPLPAEPPAKGWKTSLASAVTSMAQSIERIKVYRKCRPVSSRPPAAPSPPTASIVEKRQAVLESAVPEKKESPPDDNGAGKADASVLIPFKKFSATDLPATTPMADVPAPPVTKSKISYKTNFLSLYENGLGLLAGTGIWLRSRFQKSAVHNLSLAPRTMLVALVATLIGLAVLVFCGFGVYHVFFFDPPGPVTAETTIVPESPSKPASPAVAPSIVPHKEPRFNKPQSPLPAPTAADNPPSVQVPVVPEKTTVSAPPAAESQPPLNEPLPSAPVAAGTPATLPPETDLSIQVLKATICSAIKNRMPAAIGTAFPLSVERVYVWSFIQAEHYPTVIRHIYHHEGQVINQVDLNIRSPFWRTWSFKSIDKDRYRGHWHVDIATMDGEVLRRLYFEIN